MEKSVLEMIGGEKHINPRYDIKTESYHINEGFTGIEVNGVKFSNISEMLCYMNKQREQLIKAKELLNDFLLIAKVEHLKERYETVSEAEQFLEDMS